MGRVNVFREKATHDIRSITRASTSGFQGSAPADVTTLAHKIQFLLHCSLPNLLSARQHPLL